MRMQSYLIGAYQQAEISWSALILYAPDRLLHQLPYIMIPLRISIIWKLDQPRLEISVIIRCNYTL